MNAAGDYMDEMSERRPDLDDVTAEALLNGATVPSELELLAAFVADVRGCEHATVRPSPELSARMAAGAFDDVSGPATWRGRRFDRVGREMAGRPMWRRSTMAAGEVLAAVVARLAGMGTAAKVATGLTIAAASVTGAAATGALPDAATVRLKHVVEVVTPVHFGTDHGKPAKPAKPTPFGREVSEDAKDGGVDGGEISEKARELGRKPAQVPAGPDSHPTGKPTKLPAPDTAPMATKHPAPQPPVPDRGQAPGKPVDR